MIRGALTNGAAQLGIDQKGLRSAIPDATVRLGKGSGLYFSVSTVIGRGTLGTPKRGSHLWELDIIARTCRP